MTRSSSASTSSATGARSASTGCCCSPSFRSGPDDDVAHDAAALDRLVRGDDVVERQRLRDGVAKPAGLEHIRHPLERGATLLGAQIVDAEEAQRDAVLD